MQQVNILTNASSETTPKQTTSHIISFVDSQSTSYTYITKKVQLWLQEGANQACDWLQAICTFCNGHKKKHSSCNSLCLISIICTRRPNSNSVCKQLCISAHLTRTEWSNELRQPSNYYTTSNKKFWSEQSKWTLQQSEEIMNKNCTCMNQHEMERKYQHTLRVQHQL